MTGLFKFLRAGRKKEKTAKVASSGRPSDQSEIDFRKYYAMYKEARSLEEMGKPDEALSIYRAILRRYTPRGTAYYERPAIILERNEQYDEAIEICDRAIEAIKSGLFKADLAEFEERKARLIEKRNKALGSQC